MTITLTMTEAEAATLLACIEGQTGHLGNLELDDDDRAELDRLSAIAWRLDGGEALERMRAYGGWFTKGPRGLPIAWAPNRYSFEAPTEAEAARLFCNHFNL